ncbi:MAG: dicarboxylate/amino acid:cation symporter [Planctomycetaceae bacterium]|nr:dicarboxylate/amino acid:cation symporter [Planctomycetaceae bacterium]
MISKILEFGLLPRVALAIILGMSLGCVAGQTFVLVFATFNGFFGQYLGFCIPLIILGLVAPGIADLGKSGGRLLLVVVVISYASTLFAGFFSYTACSAIFPLLLENTSAAKEAAVGTADKGLGFLPPAFTLAIPPVFDVMTALILAFVLGIGMARIEGDALKRGFLEFRSIIEKVIVWTVIPLLPIYIFGLFLNMSHSGAAWRIIRDFGLVIGVIFALHLLLLLIQFSIGGAIARRNPFKMLWMMLPAYMTALGTSSSAATIPVTLQSAKKMDINHDIADFCIPLCAAIHLPGSTLKIVATALAVCLMDGMPHGPGLFAGFIMLLGVIMVAAPGVPGGAIMAALGVLQTSLGFSETQNALMIAIYLAIDSFGTAGNVTSDGAIAAAINSKVKPV